MNVEEIITAIPKSSDRTKFANTLRKDLYEKLQNHSLETNIPISKLLDQAVELLLKNNLTITIDETDHNFLLAYYKSKDKYNAVIKQMIKDHIFNEIKKMVEPDSGL